MLKPAGAQRTGGELPDEHSHTFPSLAITGSVHGAEGLTLSCLLQESPDMTLIKDLSRFRSKYP